MSRAPNVNWEQEIETIKDGYGDILYDLPGINNNTGMAHPVQKDGIQNAIDAIDLNNPDGWSTTYKLYNIEKPNILTITDKGTFGLTGVVLIEGDELIKLPIERYIAERWGRFESLGYANPDPRAIGARGQGKFIFIANSKRKEMIYETLRADGVYRIGRWITKGRGSEPLIEPREGKKAKRYLKKELPFLEPIKNVGTRLIIIDPDNELKKAFFPFKNCDLNRYISETWWELLLDKNKKISLKVSEWPNERIDVSLPRLYKMLIENPSEFVYYRKLVDEPISSKFKGAKVKELVIASYDKEIPAELQGMAVQRNKMKVTNFDIREGNDYISKAHSSHIFGYITFNEKAERDLRKNESTTHYNFKKIRGSLAYELFGTKGWLNARVREFAEEELGIYSGKKRKIAMGRTLTEVLHFINSLANSVGYKESVKLGKGKGGGGIHEEDRKIRIQMPPIEFPGPTRRVDFGDVIGGITARIINDTNEEIDVKFDIVLEGASKENRIAGKSQKVLKRIDKLSLTAKTKTLWYGPYTIEFADSEFTPGKYILKAKIVAVSKNKGEILHRISRAVYVSVNPPAGRGVFRDFVHSEFTGTNKKLQFRVEEEEEGKVIYVNIEHPCYIEAGRLNQILRDNKINDINPIKSYHIDIGVKALITEDLTGETRFAKDNKGLLKILQKDYDDIHGKILNTYQNLYQRNLYDAYIA